MYIDKNEIMKKFPDIRKEEALKIIKECRVKMENDGLFVPNAKKLLALKDYVEKYLGVQF